MSLKTLFPRTCFLRPTERRDSGLTPVVFAGHRAVVCWETDFLLSLCVQQDVSTKVYLEFMGVTLMLALNMSSSIFIMQILVCILERKNVYNMKKRAIHFLLARQDDKN